MSGSPASGARPSGPPGSSRAAGLKETCSSKSGRWITPGSAAPRGTGASCRALRAQAQCRVARLRRPSTPPGGAGGEVVHDGPTSRAKPYAPQAARIKGRVVMFDIGRVFTRASTRLTTCW